MHTLQWYDYVRVATSILAFISLYRLASRASSRWDNYTIYLQDLIWVLGALLFLLFEGTIESIITDTGFGPRVVIGFIVSLVAYRAMRRDEGFIRVENSKLNDKH